MGNRPGWKWAEPVETWMYGTRDNGAGVYSQPGEGGKESWYFTLVANRDLVEVGTGPYSDSEAAMQAAEKSLKLTQGQA